MDNARCRVETDGRCWLSVKGGCAPTAAANRGSFSGSEALEADRPDSPIRLKTGRPQVPLDSTAVTPRESKSFARSAILDRV